MKLEKHSVKSVRIRIFFWSVFSCIRTEIVNSVFSPNTGKYRPDKIPHFYLNTFHPVKSSAEDGAKSSYEYCSNGKRAKVKSQKKKEKKEKKSEPVAITETIANKDDIVRTV